MFGNIKYPLWYKVDYISISVFSHKLSSPNHLKVNGGSSIFTTVKQIKLKNPGAKGWLQKWIN